MGLAQDLLEQANHLANREPKRPRQASLRRAVSTAYYALFHLLVSDAISHWNKPQQRARMARGFEHTAMKDASKKIAGKDFRNSDPGMVGHPKNRCGSVRRYAAVPPRSRLQLCYKMGQDGGTRSYSYGHRGICELASCSQ